jgi:hypothetical protein
LRYETSALSLSVKELTHGGKGVVSDVVCLPLLDLGLALEVARGQGQDAGDLGDEAV